VFYKDYGQKRQKGFQGVFLAQWFSLQAGRPVKGYWGFHTLNGCGRITKHNPSDFLEKVIPCFFFGVSNFFASHLDCG